MLYANPIDIWIASGAFIAALFAVLVTWAFTTLGKPPKGSEAMYATIWGSLDEPQAYWQAPAVSIEPSRGGRTASLSTSGTDDIGGEVIPKQAASTEAPDPAVEKPNIVTIEMEIAHVEVERPMPEELRELYAEEKQKHRAPKRRKGKKNRRAEAMG